MPAKAGISLLNLYNRHIMLFDEIIDDSYEVSEYPALAGLTQEWAETRPFAGLRVLAATPVFRNTLVQYRALLAGGAELSVGIANDSNAGAEMPCDSGVVALLRESNIPVLGLQDALKAESRGEGFDLILDCAGQFSACHPKYGFVELTRSGVQFYEKCEKPVYVADSGIVKRIETSLGTGEGYVRALAQLGYGSDFTGKKFVVFGSGKVGQGIVLQLLRLGAIITVVTDTSRGANPFLEANDVPVTDCRDVDAVIALVREADFVVTATGVKGALDRVELADALNKSSAVLANMGVEDEYGPGVPNDRVLAEKKPLNFILEEPTHLKYIDASLALHAALGELLLQEAAREGANKNAGPMDPPTELEQRILSLTMDCGLIGEEVCEMLGGLPSDN